MKFQRIYVINGIPVEEFYRLNADPITLVEDGNFEMMERDERGEK